MITPTAPDRPPRDRLPRDRDLANQLQRIDQIIQEVDEAPVRRRSYAFPIAAAVALVLALVALGTLILPGTLGVVAQPSPAPTVVPTGTERAHRVGDRVVLRYLTITLREVRQREDGLAVEVQTCLTDSPPPGDGAPGWDWRATTDRGSYTVEGFRPYDARTQTGVPAFPERVGECVEGWVPFSGLGPTDGRVTVRYRDSLAESAEWTIR